MERAGTITIEELLGFLKRKDERLPFEIGAFLVLETCEALHMNPGHVEPCDVTLSHDGAVYVQPTRATSAEEATRSAASLLTRVLLAAGPGVPPDLVALVERAESGDLRTPGELAGQLGSALLPLNRGASRRVVGRLLRDATRDADTALDRGSRPSYSRLDAELDAIVASADEERPRGKRIPSQGAVPAVAIQTPIPPPPGVTTAAVPPPLEAPAMHAMQRGRPWSEGPARPRAHTTDHDLDSAIAREPRTRAGLWLGVFGALTFALIGAVAVVRPDVFTRILGEPQAPVREDPAVAAAHATALEEHRARFGTLVVHVDDDRAQILLFLGRGPVDAEGLPLGVAQEFVAVGDDGSSSRAVVPAQATWLRGGPMPRYELALQLPAPPDGGSGAGVSLGRTRLPRDVGRPGSEVGTVRVVTTPAGTKVYQLIGFAPETRVERLRTDISHELIVFREEAGLERALVGPSDWRADIDGRRVAEVNVRFRSGR